MSNENALVGVDDAFNSLQGPNALLVSDEETTSSPVSADVLMPRSGSFRSFAFLYHRSLHALWRS